MLKFLSGLKQSLGLMPRQYGSSRIVLPQDQKEGSTVFSVFPFALEGDWTMKTKTKWHWVLLIRFVLLSSPCCGSHHLARQTSEESLMSATFSFIEGVWSEAKSAATETISSLVEELDQAVSEAAIHIVTEGRSEAAVCESLLEDKQIPNVVQCSCSVGFSVTTANCKAFKYEFEHNGAKFLGSTFTVARASFTKVSGATSLDVTSCYQHMNDSRRYKRVCLLLEHGKVGVTAQYTCHRSNLSLSSSQGFEQH